MHIDLKVINDQVGLYVGLNLIFFIYGNSALIVIYLYMYLKCSEKRKAIARIMPGIKSESLEKSKDIESLIWPRKDRKAL